MKTLLVSGIADNNQCIAAVDTSGELQFCLSGSSNLGSFLQDIPGEKQQFCIAGQGGAQKFTFNFWPDVIVNDISDADTHQYALNRCFHLCQQQNKPVVNPPQVIMKTQRDQVYRCLATIPHVQIPKTIRFTPQSPQDVAQTIAAHNLTYPVILRQAGDHGGVSTVKLDAKTAIEKAMHRFALDGRPYYITEWVDFRSDDGLYRKYRLVVLSGHAYLRHLIISDNWLIHSSSRTFMSHRPDLIAEEESALKNFNTTLWPKIKPTIRLITNQLPLDYYGIDCFIKPSGDMLIFEANANMNILINHQPSPNRWDAPIANIKRRLIHIIEATAKAPLPKLFADPLVDNSPPLKII